MAEINLSASMRSNLLSLQSTQSLMDQTQLRLSTGLKVNSAVENPSSYYTAQSLSNRANDLSGLMDSMGQGISTLKATDEAIQSITTFVEQGKAIVSGAAELVPDAKENRTAAVAIGDASAAGTITVTVDGRESVIEVAATDEAADTVAAIQDALGDAFTVTDAGISYTGSSAVDVTIVSSDAGTGVAADALNGTDNTTVTGLTATDAFTFTAEQTGRADAEARFNDIMAQIDNMAGDASYKGVNLLDGKGGDLTVYFNEDRSSALKMNNVDATSGGLGLNEGISLDDNDAVNASLTKIDEAISTLRGYAEDFGNNYATVENWEGFTENLINTLTEGSDKLTLADMNEEGANMLALQTRQQLATNALSLASQSDQTVLRLF